MSLFIQVPDAARGGGRVLPLLGRDTLTGTVPLDVLRTSGYRRPDEWSSTVTVVEGSHILKGLPSY